MTELREFVRRDVLERFLRYVRMGTASDESQTTRPTTPGQLELLRRLEAECRELDLADITLDPRGFLYATLPASPGVSAPAFALLAHVDTSPEQPGHGVEPVVHERWSGAPIAFARAPELLLSSADCPALAAFAGDDIVTASGDTLLGADDKAGVAEIMTTLAALRRFGLPHGEIRACFTTDEEVGRGVEGIDIDRLPLACYTVDGGLPGEIEGECFDAWAAQISLTGVGVHPGVAKDALVNAATAAARLVAALPRAESPECTAGRDGFYYVYQLEGGCERAAVRLIVRDFEREANLRRLDALDALAAQLMRDTPGLDVRVERRFQYPNMREVVARHPEVLAHARGAIADAGLPVIEKSIRGGTDGSLLSGLGRPTPNLFCGGQLGHSRREWIARGAMVSACETLLHLARRWGLASS